jgi:cytochrome c556
VDIRKTADAAATAAATTAGGASSAQASSDPWSPVISPLSLEDEIKRVRLHFDSVVTTPGAFNSGGYQDARRDLTVLASLFAVVNEHGGDVRWKDQAAAARDLIARTAFNCKAGSTQVYNETKLRKGDLQDLVSGSGLANREAEPENDWSMIADRSPLMEYADALIERLEGAARDEASIKAEADLIKRNSELLAMLGEVFTREGMDEADDADYAKFSRQLTDAAKGVTAAIERGDTDAVRQGTGAIRQRCDACHEHYR